MHILSPKIKDKYILIFKVGTYRNKGNSHFIFTLKEGFNKFVCTLCFCCQSVQRASRGWRMKAGFVQKEIVCCLPFSFSADLQAQHWTAAIESSHQGHAALKNKPTSVPVQEQRWRFSRAPQLPRLLTERVCFCPSDPVLQRAVCEDESRGELQHSCWVLSCLQDVLWNGLLLPFFLYPNFWGQKQHRLESNHS